MMDKQCETMHPNTNKEVDRMISFQFYQSFTLVVENTAAL